MAHHLKKGEGGARGASHRPACDHPRCYTDRCYHPLRVIGAWAQRLQILTVPTQLANDLSSIAGLTATPWWLLQHGDLS